MPQINIPRNYQDGQDLYQADLDAAMDAVQTFLNATKLDGDNLQSGAVTTAALADSSVTSSKIAAGAVLTNAIADANVTKAKLDTTATAYMVPTGAILTWAAPAAPTGWLLCNGSAISRTTYAALFAVLGTSHGQGDNSTTFNLPDYRGRFLRGVDGSAGRDPNLASRTAMSTGGNTAGNVGSVQGQATALNGITLHDPGHNHTYNIQPSIAAPGSAVGGQGGSLNTGTSTTGITLTGDLETRPINAYVNFVIKT